MSPQPGVKATSTHRVWSHNTNYTGAAGIHSEDGPVAHARNSLMDHQSAAVITAEEEILRKKIKSLSVSRKSLETSMLCYSQKMKDIADKREQIAKSSSSEEPLRFSGKNSGIKTIASRFLVEENSFRQQQQKRNMPLSSLQYHDEDAKISPKKNPAVTEKPWPSSPKSEIRGRGSVDSGLGMDSDSCTSDSEIITRSSLPSNASVHSDDIEQQDSMQSPKSKTVVRRSIRDRKKRFRRHNMTELPTLFDTENSMTEVEGGEDSETSSHVETDESVTISPFPEYYRDTDTLSSRLGSISEYEEVSDDLNRTRILNPITSSPIRPWKKNISPKPKKKTPHVLTKPKAAHSPSLASIRLRRAGFYRKPNKKNKKSSLHAFKYSDAVETALRSLNNSPDGRRDNRIVHSPPRLSPDLPGLDLNELLNEVIQRADDLDILRPDEPEEIEFKPHRLYRERSFSDPMSRLPVFTSTLEQVREDDDSELRSVLKKHAVQYPAEKKSVQFFLPDIFLHANACTSRPAALR